ncbi:hypothetical protein CGL56_02640 [Neolewinella marina]|uniref:Uncharacterized protein n=2 Tax=Neolewinella marina TaxID=438751 RepID=A0A2G0CIZ8_9BACT|nr:hypothetical protein CGL56_02640 [Neolewinella marina]
MQSPARALTPQLGWTHPVGWPSMTFPGTRGPAPLASTSSGYGSPAFDFAATKPYLAFFCRLELNIEEATRFPVRFRLGEVRGWQQELGRRD